MAGYNLLPVRAFVNKVGGFLPQGYADAARQIGLFVCADLLYETVRGIAQGKAVQAFANGQQIIDWERSMGAFFEPDVQAFFLDHRWVIDIANFMYVNSHFVVTTSFLIWLYLRRNETFYFVRNMFMVAMLIALVGYALLPTAPPRFFPQEGFIDTIKAFTPVDSDSAAISTFVNPYAAIPSMHCAFSLMIGISAAMVVRNRFAKLLWSLYPLMVLFTVVVTGNHFWLDAVAGALVALASALAAREILARVRPTVWAFRPATA